MYFGYNNYEHPAARGFAPLLEQGNGPLVGMPYYQNTGNNWGGGGYNIFGQNNQSYYYRQPSFSQFAPEMYQQLSGTTPAFDFGRGIGGGGLGDLLFGGGMLAVQGHNISQNIQDYGAAGWVQGGFTALSVLGDLFAGVERQRQQPVYDYLGVTQQLNDIRSTGTQSLPEYSAYRASFDMERMYSQRASQLDEQIKSLRSKPQNSGVDAEIALLERDKSDSLKFAKDQRTTTDSMYSAVNQRKDAMRAQEAQLAAQQKDLYLKARAIDTTA